MEIIRKSEIKWTNTDESGKDILLENKLSGEVILIKNELPEDNIVSIYFCDATIENYQLLTNAGCVDINNCIKYLDNKHHIRFNLDTYILYRESVGTFCLNSISRRAIFRHISTIALKDMIKLIKDKINDL